MAALLIKRLILVTFIFLCFFSVTSRARSLGMVWKDMKQNKLVQEEEKIEPKEQDLPEVTESTTDLITMDYTPARKKPPIHN